MLRGLCSSSHIEEGVFRPHSCVILTCLSIVVHIFWWLKLILFYNRFLCVCHFSHEFMDSPSDSPEVIVVMNSFKTKIIKVKVSVYITSAVSTQTVSCHGRSWSSLSCHLVLVLPFNFLCLERDQCKVWSQVKVGVIPLSFCFCCYTGKQWPSGHWLMS